MVPSAGDLSRKGINQLTAVAEADDGFRGTAGQRLDEFVIFDSAVVAGDDYGDVAMAVDRQGCNRRLRVRGDAVVDKQDAVDFTQFLLAVRQSSKSDGCGKGLCRIDIKRLRDGQRGAQIGR